MRSISTHSVKHIPERTCLACRQKKAKQDLIRLVRTSDGRVEVDTGSKKAGRGAYLCAVPECWQLGLKGGRLDHALRTTLTVEDRQKLIEAAGTLALSTAA